jgi:hypothetical protein
MKKKYFNIQVKNSTRFQLDLHKNLNLKKNKNIFLSIEFLVETNVKLG